MPAGGKAALKDPALSYNVTPPRTMGSKRTAVVLKGDLYVFRQSITSDHGPSAWYNLGKAPVFTTTGG